MINKELMVNEENLEFEICKETIEAVTVIFSGKWAFRVMGELHNQTKRFNELNRALGISTKSLSDTLKQLETNGIIDRAVFPTVPVTVEYSLTERGKDFEKVFIEMKIWAEKWLIE